MSVFRYLEVDLLLIGVSKIKNIYERRFWFRCNGKCILKVEMCWRFLFLGRESWCVGW